MPAVWFATADSTGGAVGCFCPDALIHALRVVFGDDVECDGIDHLDGHSERTIQAASELGIRLDSPAVLTTARNERHTGPRYEFRLRVGVGAFVAGRLDRRGICVVCANATDFPEPAKGRFVEFLRSLMLGSVSVGTPEA